MKCMGGCGAEIEEGLYCASCAGEPDKTTYLRDRGSWEYTPGESSEEEESEGSSEPL